MSLTTILATVKSWITTAEQWVEALFSKLIRDAQELIPVVDQFITTAEGFINSPTAVTIEGLIPSGLGTDIANIANEVLAWILGELTSISGELVTASVATSGVPQYANPDAVAQTAFTKVSQLSAAGQAHFLSGYSTMLLQKFAPAGVDLSYEEAQTAQVIAKTAIAQTAAAQTVS